MFENLQKAVQAIADNMTLKSDYSEELEQLDAIEGDIAVFRTLGTPVWKCVTLRKQIQEIRDWIKEETGQ